MLAAPASLQFVGDEVTDTYAETHTNLLPEQYKSIHYAYQGMGLRYRLGVYDKVVADARSSRRPDGLSPANKTTIPTRDLAAHLEVVLGQLVL